MDMATVASIGIDLGKSTFHLVALDCHTKVILRKKFSRPQLLVFTANMPWSLIGMEACSGAHFIASRLRDQGHEVKLIPAQFVKPYRKSNKNDFIDAEAIAEAVTRRNMRFVPIKTDDQLDLQALDVLNSGSKMDSECHLDLERDSKRCCYTGTKPFSAWGRRGGSSCR